MKHHCRYRTGPESEESPGWTSPKETIPKSGEGEEPRPSPQRPHKDTESVVKAALKDKHHSSVSHLLLWSQMFRSKRQEIHNSMPDRNEFCFFI